jgi:hypothetical protein
LGVADAPTSSFFQGSRVLNLNDIPNDAVCGSKADRPKWSVTSEETPFLMNNIASYELKRPRATPIPNAAVGSFINWA